MEGGRAGGEGVELGLGEEEQRRRRTAHAVKEGE